MSQEQREILRVQLIALADAKLLIASGDDLTDSDDLGRKMMRQVAGAFADMRNCRLVAKLRSGRERKRKETGNKEGGRKSHAELWPEVSVQSAQELAAALVRRSGCGQRQP